MWYFIALCTTAGLIIFFVLTLWKPSTMNAPFAIAILVTCLALAVSFFIQICETGTEWSQGKLVAAVLSTANASATAGLMVRWLIRSRRSRK